MMIKHVFFRKTSFFKGGEFSPPLRPSCKNKTSGPEGLNVPYELHFKVLIIYKKGTDDRELKALKNVF